MPKNPRLPILALSLVALAHAVPQHEAPTPPRLANDFVFRTLQKEKEGNAAIAPGGPLAGMAAIGAAGQTLPAPAVEAIGGSAAAAEKLLQVLGRAESGINLRHTRTAWMESEVPVEPSILTVRPAAVARDEAPKFLDRVSSNWRLNVMPTKSQPVEKPAGLATVSAFDATDVRMFSPVGPQGRLRFEGKPVETLYSIGKGYAADEIAETVTLRMGATSHLLVLTLPRAKVKLEDLLPEVASRVEFAVASEEERLPIVRFPRIAQTSEADVADALGLGKTEVSARTRTAVAIGATWKETATRAGGGGMSSRGGGMTLPLFRPMPLPLMGAPSSSPSRGGGKTVTPVEVNFDRPFVYAVVDSRSRTIVLAGIVREVPEAKDTK